MCKISDTTNVFLAQNYESPTPIYLSCVEGVRRRKRRLRATAPQLENYPLLPYNMFGFMWYCVDLVTY